MADKKQEKKPKKRGGIFILLGLLFILGAGGLVVYNNWESQQALKASEDVANVLKQEILAERVAETTPAETAEDAQETETAVEPTEAGNPWDMPSIEIDGNFYIGLIEIPEASISLPVISDWDYDKLKIAPCRFTGSVQGDDLVICAHNYSTHFSGIKWLSPGADVYFTTADGHAIHYMVSTIQTVQPTDVSTMIEDGNDPWDLTLFTCSTDGRTRCAVRCVRVKE